MADCPQLVAKTGGDQSYVGSDRSEGEAEIPGTGRGGAVSDVNAGDDVVLLAGGDDGGEGSRQHVGQRMGSVENLVDLRCGFATETEAQVGRTDIQGVDSVDGCDLIQLAHSRRGFDLDCNEGRLVERTDPSGLHPIRACARRRISGGGNSPLGIRGGLDQRDDDTVRPQIEGAADWSGLDLCNPNQSANAVTGKHGEQRCVELTQVDSVLGVNHHEVRSNGRSGVDDRRVAGHTPEPVRGLLLTQTRSV